MDIRLFDLIFVFLWQFAGKSWDTATQSIKLGLGIGGGFGQSQSIVIIKHGKYGLTPAQLRELEQQSLILKYMVAGLPVPVHLVLSIWKSVASSFGSTNGGIYKQYPSCKSNLQVLASLLDHFLSKNDCSWLELRTFVVLGL